MAAPGALQRLAREPDVAHRQPLEEAVERPDRPAEREVDAALEPVRLLAVRLQQQRRKRRRQRQRVDRRDDRADRDRQRELLVELAARAR